MSPRGKAAVDYICVPHETLELCNYFKVLTSRSIIEDANLFPHLGERSKVPDHSALTVEFRTLHSAQNLEGNSAHTGCLNGAKRYKLRSIPNEFLSSDLSKLALQNIIGRTESARETQNEINNI